MSPAGCLTCGGAPGGGRAEAALRGLAWPPPPFLGAARKLRGAGRGSAAGSS